MTRIKCSAECTHNENAEWVCELDNVDMKWTLGGVVCKNYDPKNKPRIRE